MAESIDEHDILIEVKRKSNNEDTMQDLQKRSHFVRENYANIYKGEINAPKSCKHLNKVESFSFPRFFSRFPAEEEKLQKYDVKDLKTEEKS